MGDDKPVKILNAVEVLRGYEDCRPCLSIIKIEEEVFELKIILKKIFPELS